MRFDAGALEGHENAAKQRPSGTKAAKTFENPIVRGLLGISSVPPPENARPTPEFRHCRFPETGLPPNFVLGN